MDPGLSRSGHRGVLARGFGASVLVLLGGVVVSVLPASTPLLRWSVATDVRGSDAGLAAGFVVVVLGLLLLAREWLGVLRRVADGSGSEALVRAAAVAWSLPLVVAPPLFSRDGWSYAAQGMLARLGFSPYDHGTAVLHGPIVEAVDPQWLTTTTPYGPVPLAFGRLAATVTGEPWTLVVAHRLLALVGLTLLAWAVPRLARWTGADPAYASALVLASPFMLTSGVAGLHNDLLMAGLMAGALVLAVERGWVWGALAGGAAAAVKAPGGLVCIAVALVTLPAAAAMLPRLVRLVSVAVVSAGLLLGLGVVTGVGSGWVRGLATPGTNNTPLSVPTLLGTALDWVASPTGLADHALLDVARLLGSALTLLVVLAVAFVGRTGDRTAGVRAAALLLAVTVLLSPASHLWYFLWPLPFVAALRLSRPATAGLVGALLVAGLAAPVDTPELLVVTLLVVAVAAVLWLAPAARRAVLPLVDRVPLPQTAGATRPATSPSVIRPPSVPGAE